MIEVLVALVGAIATIAAAAISARATARTSEQAASELLNQLREMVTEENFSSLAVDNLLRKEQDLARRIRGTPFLISPWSAVIAVLVASLFGFYARTASEAIESAVRDRVLGELNAIAETRGVSISTIGGISSIGPWKILPNTATESVTSGRTIGRGKDGALQVSVELRKWGSEGSEDYAGVGLGAESLPNDPVVLAVAWVFVEASDSSRKAQLKAHLIGYTEDQEGGYLGLYGPDTALLPGEWTPLILGASFDAEIRPGGGAGAEEIRFQSRDSRLSSLNLTVWAAEGSFNGSVYVDDATFYSRRTDGT